MDLNKEALAAMEKMLRYLELYQHIVPIPRTELVEISKIVYNFKRQTESEHNKED